MVWGVALANGFGDYFPDGEYVGWHERLKDYYDNEMPDAEKAEMGMGDRILYSKFSNKFTADKGPLKPHECPTEFRTRQTYKSLGSLIDLNERLLAVDETLKRVIEGLEPGMHQFWPIRIVMPKGTEYSVPFYGMVIRRFLDSFSPDRSEEGSWYRRENGLHFVQVSTVKAYGGLALSQATFATAHLWRERRLLNPNFFLSDELHAEIARLGLRTPKRYRLKTL